MVNFKEIYHFQSSRGGSTFSRGPTFSRGGGGGSNCLFPIETHITCDFPGGGPDPLSPPLDPHLHGTAETPQRYLSPAMPSPRGGGGMVANDWCIGHQGGWTIPMWNS